MFFRRKNFLIQVIILTSIITLLLMIQIIDLSSDFISDTEKNRISKLNLQKNNSLSPSNFPKLINESKRLPASEGQIESFNDINESIESNESLSTLNQVIDSSINLIKPISDIVSDAEEKIEINELEVTVIDSKCDFASSYTVNTTSIRLIGECHRLPLVVINESNGYEASVFTMDQFFTTDFIRLRLGKNILKIQSQDQNQQKIWQELSIIVESF